MELRDEKLREELAKHTCEIRITDNISAIDILLSRKKCERCIELNKNLMKTRYGIEEQND